MLDNPRYQRALQRIAAIPPDKQAILRGRYKNLDAAFAAMDANKKLDSEEYSAALGYRNAKLDLQRKAYNLNTETARNRLDFLEDQDLLSSGVGLVQAGAAGKLGRETDAIKIRTAKKLLGLGV